jgi:hypothetical protein
MIRESKVLSLQLGYNIEQISAYDVVAKAQNWELKFRLLNNLIILGL